MSERQKLYEISDLIERTIMDNVDEDTGELSSEVSDQLDSLSLDAAAKALACAAYVKGLRAEASACDEVAKRARKLKRQADQLVDYLEHHAIKAGIDGERLADGYSELVWRESTRTEIVDPRSVPLEFCGEPLPSKTLIKAAMDRAELDELKTDSGFVFARRDRAKRLSVK